MHSYSSKCLVIDLTEQKAVVRKLPESWLRSYLGGVGLGTRLLFEWVKPKTDPLSPDNVIIFASGGLAGTMAPASSNHAIVTKSPLTGFLSDSVASGHWSLSLKRTGFDALVVTGAASTPIYLLVDNEAAHFKKADHLSGKSAPQTSEEIRRHLADDRIQVASIGPGGENLVCYASISDGYPLSQRGGAGAVMGSKKLKAIAIRGTKPISAYDLPALERASIELYGKAQPDAVSKSRRSETLDCLQAVNRSGALPTGNFQECTFAGADRLSWEHTVKAIACPTCPIACRHLLRVVDGPYAGAEAALDYQTLAALGPLCRVDDMPAILKASELCQLYGLDTVSTGGSIAWAMESFERGLFTRDDTEGIDLSFGNADALVEMVERIGKSEGIGSVLAEGTKRASSRLGRNSEKWAMHCKGLEIAGCDPRGAEEQALSSAIGLQTESLSCPLCSTRNADPPTNMSLRNQEREDLAAIFASLMICDLTRDCFQDPLTEAAHLYASATGMDLTPADLRLAGERVNTLKKAFNIREGWRRSDDSLPPRLLEDTPCPKKRKSDVLSGNKLQAMIDDYYQTRGWTAEGRMPLSKLRALGMDDLLDMAMEP